MTRLPIIFALSLFALSACGGAAAPTPPRSPSISSDLYLCGEGQFLIVERSEAGEALALRYGALVERLRPLSAPEGARPGAYEGETLRFDEGLEARGGARLEAPGLSLACLQDERTRELESLIQKGLRFLGLGNEPSVALLLFDDRYSLSLDEGSREQKGAIELLALDDARSVRVSLETFGDPLTLAIEAAPCEDTMSGARFSHRFGLSQGDQKWSGCGFVFGDLSQLGSAEAAPLAIE